MISKKLITDFEMSSQFKHNGVRGAFREDKLKDFLKEGKLPPKYAVGSGEVISPYFGNAKQSDIIIYDRDKCPTLIYGEDNSVFPTEGVYGIIEVKSKLSKQKLLEGLNNIADFKRRIKIRRTTKIIGSEYSVSFRASSPFGIIFAYDLDGNSLDSLKQNYIDWKQDKNNLQIPNLIVVLNKGIIFNTGRMFKKIINTNELLDNKTYVSKLDYQEDTLFEFYVLLYDLLSSMELGKVNLREYEEVPIKIGKYFVKGRIIENFYKGEENYRLKESFIEKLYISSKPIQYYEVLKKTYGTLPEGCEESDFSYVVNFYDPDDLPTLDINRISEYIKKDDNNTYQTVQKLKMPQYDIEINGETYIFPIAYVTDEDSEKII